MGLDFRGNPLYAPVDAEVLTQQLIASLSNNGAGLRRLSPTETTGAVFRGPELQRGTIDIGDVRSAGWAILINKADPRHDELLAALKPLSDHRGMETVLEYTATDPLDWSSWL